MVCAAELIGHILFGRYRVTRDRGNGCDGTLLRAAPTGHARLGDPFSERVNSDVMLEIIARGAGYDPRQVDDLASIQPHPHLLRCQEITLVADGEFAGAAYVVWDLWENTLAGVLAGRTLLDEQEVRAMAKEIAAALARYHSDNRVHGNVRADRICRVDRHWKLAPVLRRGTNEGKEDVARTATPEDDIYALGLMLLGCLSPKFAVRGKAAQSATQAEIERALRELPQLSQHWLRRCLAAEPSQRCSAAELALMDAEVPPSVVEVFADREGPIHRLQWQQPSRGTVQVYRWSRGRCPAQGEIWLRADLERIADMVPLVTPTAVHIQLQPRAACQIIVVTLIGDAAVIGDSITLTWAADVQGLRLSLEGKLITATWDWPEGAYDADVVVRRGAYPIGPDDPQRLGKARSFRAGYMSEGRFVIPIEQETGVVCVAVYAKYPYDDGCEWASGRTVGARAMITVAPNVRLHYRVTRISRLAQWLLGSEPCRLSVRADRTASLPELALIAGENSSPFDAGSGLPVLQVPARQYEEGVVVQTGFRPPKGVKIENTRLLARGKALAGVRLIPERE